MSRHHVIRDENLSERIACLSERPDFLLTLVRILKRIEDYTLVALTLMIAESRPEEKEVMVNVVMNCLMGEHETW
jgi:hypothetical protein